MTVGERLQVTVGGWGLSVITADRMQGTGIQHEVNAPDGGQQTNDDMNRGRKEKDRVGGAAMVQ